MVDLKAAPFSLSDEDITWVEKTYASLSEDEKLGQLFVDMLWQDDDAEIESRIAKYGMGGFRYGNMSPEKLYHQNAVIQKASKVPALIAANIEAGGNGGVAGGTPVGTPVAIGATRNPENAYYMGYYGCKEAAAIGCNWTFAPIVDIDYNWRNCVISNRVFGDDPDLVLENSLAYLRGAKEAGLAACAKHFPGDGCDERDQHIVTTINDKSYDEWMNTFGKVYKGMIDAGVQSVMIGHIQAPEVSRALRPGIRDEDIMPATMAPELLQDMLRGKLGFNGLIITDATHMVGLTGKVRRHDFVPGVIEAGCDMVLYYRSKDEDMDYMREALRDGRLSQQRFEDAVTRVLGFKAMLGLHKKQAEGTLMPPESGLSVVGCEEHMARAKKIADESITLVKNTRNQLPLTPETHKRIMLYTIDSGAPMMMRALGEDGKKPETVGDKLKTALTAAGFDVDTPHYEGGANGKQLLAGTPVGEFVSKYDAVILVANVTGFSQSNERRIHWSMPMGPDIPWYATELPTVMISLNNPFHLIDAAMVPTYINAYSPEMFIIEAVVDKITGKSEFKGVSSVDAFCGAWDTRL